MKHSQFVLCALLIAASAVATGFWYPDLPAFINVHWDLHGQPDGVGPRAMLWLLGPGAMAGMLLIGMCLPWLSPKRFDLSGFKSTYSYFIVVIVCMLGLLHAALLQATLSGMLDLPRTIQVGAFALLILLGNPMAKVKRNFYIGVRTPWTLASERVWHATHRLCGKLMVVSGLFGLIAVLADASTWIVLALLAGWSVIVIIFSLVHYKRLEHAGTLEAACYQRSEA
jgi:uncharacterized membrane protein